MLNGINAQFALENQLQFITHPCGLIQGNVSTELCSGQFYLHGAHVAQFQPAGAEPLLFHGSGADKIDRFSITSYSGPSSQNTPVYFNELFISRVPEPSVMGLFVVAVAASLTRRRLPNWRTKSPQPTSYGRGVFL